MKANGALAKNTHGFSWDREHDKKLYLKQFVICQRSGAKFTGYKKTKKSGKEYFYYKVNTTNKAYFFIISVKKFQDEFHD